MTELLTSALVFHSVSHNIYFGEKDTRLHDGTKLKKVAVVPEQIAETKSFGVSGSRRYWKNQALFGQTANKKTQTLDYLALQFLPKRTSMCVPNVMETYAVVIETFNTKPQMVALLEAKIGLILWGPRTYVSPIKYDYRTY